MMLSLLFNRRKQNESMAKFEYLNFERSFHKLQNASSKATCTTTTSSTRAVWMKVLAILGKKSLSFALNIIFVFFVLSQKAWLSSSCAVFLKLTFLSSLEDHKIDS
jgi:hypothetical protein